MSETDNEEREVRRSAFENAVSEQPDEHQPSVTSEGEAPQGLDTSQSTNKSNGKFWVLAFAFFLLFLVIAGISVFSFLRSDGRKDTIDISSDDARNKKETQYSNAEDTIKTAYNTNTANSSSPQPTPPPNANVNANTVNRPYPNLGMADDWDKIPNPADAPKGNVGENLGTNQNNASSEQSGNSGSRGSGGGTRSNPAPVATPQVIEVANPDNRSTDYRSGSSSSRNDQTSIYYFARNDEGVPTLNRLANATVRLAQKPRFNDVMPIRILGSLHSLGSGGLARMVLTRPVEGNGYYLPKGTFFIGRVSGGEGNRLFIALVGYIDPRSQGLVTLGGDVTGIDGGLGLKGERKRLDNRLQKFFSQAWNTSRELGIAYLLGRRGGGGNWNGGLDSRIDSLSQNFDSNQTKEFIVVQSGQEGYIVVNDLPPATDKPLSSAPVSVPQAVNNTPRTPPTDVSTVNNDDLQTLANFGEAQIKELMAMPAQERERALAKYSPQVQQILREALK